MNTTKVCPFCREAIHEAARKCPRCQQWQGWSRLFVYAPVAVLVLAFVLLQQRLEATREAWRDQVSAFESHRSEVRVLDSSMHYSTESACPNLSTIGRIQNDGDVTWENPVLEVRYFDKAGNLIDTQASREYIVIPSHGEAAFVLRSKAVRAEGDYATHKVEVKAARDARSLSLF